MNEDIIKKVGGIEHYKMDSDEEIDRREVWCSKCCNWFPEEKAKLVNGFVECDNCRLNPYKN